jgi:hypothetical protein
VVDLLYGNYGWSTDKRNSTRSVELAKQKTGGETAQRGIHKKIFIAGANISRLGNIEDPKNIELANYA